MAQLGNGFHVAESSKNTASVMTERQMLGGMFELESPGSWSLVGEENQSLNSAVGEVDSEVLGAFDQAVPSKTSTPIIRQRGVVPRRGGKEKPWMMRYSNMQRVVLHM
jgi:hypothetical protein